MHETDSIEEEGMIQGLSGATGACVMPFAIGDVRVAARGEWLADRIVATGSVVLRRVGETRAGEVAVQRFLSSPYVSVSSIMGTLAARTAQQCVGRRIVVVQDTTEINFAHACGRRRGFGPTSNGRDPGFFIHPLIAIDVEDEAVIGIVGAEIWTRAAERVSARRQRPIEDKESARWLNGCARAASILSETAGLTMVADRESDIYELFARLPAGLDLIVRAARDRRLACGESLFKILADAPALAQQTVRIAPRGPGDKGRDARVELRAGTVRIRRPTHLDRGLPEHIELSLVEAREIDPPNLKDQICWYLLTTHTVRDARDAAEIVNLYRLRWRIEQVFRALKSDGLRLDQSQIADVEHMLNLAAVAVGAAVRTIQLVDARDGSLRPATDVLDAELSIPLARISKTLEGKTERQKNPHPPTSLACVAWVAARLGGWNCYYKPPGPKTMHQGWNQLAPMLAGYVLATAEALS